MTFIYLKSYLFSQGHYDLRPVFRWHTDNESDFWSELEKKWREQDKKERMNHYQAKKHYLPEQVEIERQQGKLDKDEIKSRIDILNLYALYFPDKGQARGSGRYRQISCGLHGEDRMASMSLDTELNRFNCFACGEKGDTIDLVMKLEGVGFRQALEIMNRL